MAIECQQGHKFRYAPTSYKNIGCPYCDSEMKRPYYTTKEIVERLENIAELYQEKHQEKQSSIRGITIDMDTDKMQLKLRAIAKHAEALADELDAIDNAWQCDCGCTGYVDESLINSGTDEVICAQRICNDCGEAYAIPNEPTHKGESNEFL